MIIVKDTQYVVKQIGTKKYLHNTVSKFGSSINLTEDVESITYYKTIDDARDKLVGYLMNTKTMKASMFTIESVERCVKSVKSTSALPSEEKVYIGSYGYTEADTVTEETVKSILENKYKTSIESLDLEFNVEDVPAYPYSPEGPTYKYVVGNVKNIIWKD